MDALSAALTGEVEGTVSRSRWRRSARFGELVARIRDPEARTPVPQGTAAPQGHAARLPAAGPGLAGRDVRDSASAAVLADDMGLGKTITCSPCTCTARATPTTAGPTLVVCPASLLGNWQREAARFAPPTPVRRYHGGDRHLDDLAGDEIVLVTYGVLRRDREVLAETAWSLVAADEAQHVKNPYAVTARELRALPARARVALTGTPVENNLSELWALLDWTTPGLLGPLTAFRDRHARAIEAGEDPAGRRAAVPSRPPVPAAPQEVRPRHRPRTAAQDRDRPRRPADGRAGQPVRGTGPRDHGEDRGVGGHRPARPGAQAPHRAEADLQPPRPVPERDGLRRSTALRAAPASSNCSTNFSTPSPPKASRVLVFTQYKQMASSAGEAPRRARRPHPLPARRHPRRPARGDGRPLPAR